MVRLSFPLAIFTLLAAFTVGAHADTITYSESAIVSGVANVSPTHRIEIPLAAMQAYWVRA
jgi:hypothetical protein